MKKHTAPLSIKFIVVLLLSNTLTQSQLLTTPSKSIKKTAIITGELSGEELAEWFLEKTQIHKTHLVYAVTPNNRLEKFPIIKLKDYKDLAEVNIFNGLSKLLSQIIRQQSTYKKLLTHIIEINPEHLILVDLPWVNLRLARSIKKRFPATHVTFIAPPELWFWGCWGIDKFLKNYCDECIVLYPHEQAWYSAKGVNTSWLGYPHIENFRSFIEQPTTPQSQIALLPGSRPSEIEKNLPLFCKALKKCKTLGEFKIILIQAASIQAQRLSQIIAEENLQDLITIIPQEDRACLSSCFYALTKPGTITLHLALLGIPHAVIFKTSWVNYFILNNIINPKALGLPNLLSDTKVSDEFIQNEASPENLAIHIDAVFSAFKKNAESYTLQRHKVARFAKVFLDHD